MPTIKSKKVLSDACLAARREIWSRIESTAIAHHALVRKHGLYARIANDAARSSQAVADWKSLRTPVPLDVIERLAEKYETSKAYLLTGTCGIDDHEDLGARMEVIVTNMIDRVNVNVPAKTAIQMCDTALKGLIENHEESRIYGALFMLILPLPLSPSAVIPLK